MQIGIEVLDATPKTDKNKNGKVYSFIELAYKRLPEGKVEGRKIMSFTSEAVYEGLKPAKKGDKFSITSEKDDKGFWNWVGIGAYDETLEVPINSPTAPGRPVGTSPRAPTGRVVGNTYETPLERANKQIYISRQSSLDRSLQFLQLNGKKAATKEEVTEIAQYFADWVLTLPKKDAMEAILEMPDDIPA